MCTLCTCSCLYDVAVSVCVSELSGKIIISLLVINYILHNYVNKNLLIL